jgi:hypothetical protein
MQPRAPYGYANPPPWLRGYPFTDKTNQPVPRARMSYARDLERDAVVVGIGCNVCSYSIPDPRCPS